MSIISNKKISKKLLDYQAFILHHSVKQKLLELKTKYEKYIDQKKSRSSLNAMFDIVSL